jgi:hypothetical protein
MNGVSFDATVLTALLTVATMPKPVGGTRHAPGTLKRWL